VLAWYFGQVFGKSNGGSKPLFFFLMPSYYGFVTAAPPEYGDTIGDELAASRDDGSVRVLKLTKSYGDTTAVKEMTLELTQNKVYAFLGHNGAGKTTLLNM
jgi:ABC-type transport system involved in cytochrome bd biosynthesis fused ATPase/permease subunit